MGFSCIVCETSNLKLSENVFALCEVDGARAECARGAFSFSLQPAFCRLSTFVGYAMMMLYAIRMRSC